LTKPAPQAQDNTPVPLHLQIPEQTAGSRLVSADPGMGPVRIDYT
jgi:hypothetical protein